MFTLKKISFDIYSGIPMAKLKNKFCSFAYFLGNTFIHAIVE